MPQLLIFQETPHSLAESFLRYLRASLAATALLLWFALSMQGASPHTSWEHHPYGAPFVALKESRSVADFLFSGAWLTIILVPAGIWVRCGTAGWLIASLAVASLSLALSWQFACWASC